MFGGTWTHPEGIGVANVAVATQPDAGFETVGVRWSPSPRTGVSAFGWKLGPNAFRLSVEPATTGLGVRFETGFDVPPIDRFAWCDGVYLVRTDEVAHLLDHKQVIDAP